MFTDYTEVRNTHLDETDGFWRIDAWETGDDSEEGKVVAYVHDKSGDAVICAPKARLSEKVKEASQYHQLCWWFAIAPLGQIVIPPKGGLANRSLCYW